MVVNKVKEVPGGDVLVRWEPPLDGACLVVRYNVYYREVILHVKKSKWNSVAVNRNVTSYTLHLKCNKKYEIAVTSLNAYRESDISDSQIWKFKTKGGNTNDLFAAVVCGS